MKLKNYLHDPGWLEVLEEEFHAPYFKKMEEELSTAYKEETIYPKKDIKLKTSKGA